MFKLKRTVLSALLTLAVAAAPMAMGASAAASPAKSESPMVVSGRSYYVRESGSNRYLTEDKGNVFMTSDRSKAKAFQMNYDENKGYQIIYAGRAVTADSISYGANVSMKDITGADTQWWSMYHDTADNALAANGNPYLFLCGDAGEGTTAGNVYVGGFPTGWLYEDANTSNFLPTGQYTIYNPVYDRYLSYTLTPGGQPSVFLTETKPGTGTTWQVTLNNAQTGSYVLKQPGVISGVLSCQGPGEAAAIKNNGSEFVVVKESGNTYRIVCSSATWAVMGVSGTTSTGAPLVQGVDMDMDDGAHSWVFTKVA